MNFAYIDSYRNNYFLISIISIKSHLTAFNFFTLRRSNSFIQPLLRTLRLFSGTILTQYQTWMTFTSSKTVKADSKKSNSTTIRPMQTMLLKVHIYDIWCQLEDCVFNAANIYSRFGSQKKPCKFNYIYQMLYTLGRKCNGSTQ